VPRLKYDKIKLRNKIFGMEELRTGLLQSSLISRFRNPTYEHFFKGISGKQEDSFDSNSAIYVNWEIKFS
jgi:hypothetical protein